MTQRPLMLTVEYEEDWHPEDQTFEGWSILRINGHEIHREPIMLGRDLDDMEQWAVDLLREIIKRPKRS